MQGGEIAQRSQLVAVEWMRPREMVSLIHQNNMQVAKTSMQVSVHVHLCI